MNDRDYKFSEALKFDTSIRDLPVQIHNIKVREVAENYVSNIERVRSLGMMPILFVRIASSNYLDMLNTNAQTTEGYIQQAKDTEDMLKHSMEITSDPQLIIERQEMLKRCQVQIGVLENSLQRFRDSDFVTKGDANLGLGVADYFVERMLVFHKLADKEDFLRGLDATLGGMILGMWTAFEMLATDLWVMAVNLRPMTLGVSALEQSALVKVQDSIENNNSKKMQSIELNIMKKYKFNLGDRIGSILKDERKYGFNKLDDIADAYQLAFSASDNSGKRRGCPEQVKAWFRGKDYDQLRVLEAIRHVLVHRGGRVDRSFLERVKGIHPVLALLSENHLIPMDGEMVRDFAIASSDCGARLLKGVDQWLTTHLD